MRFHGCSSSTRELTCPLLGHTGTSWCFTGASLGQGCRDKCPDPDRRAVQRTVEYPQLQFSFKVVIIPVGAQRLVPMVSLFCRPWRFSCCSTFDKVFDVPVYRSTVSSGAVVEMTAELPSFSMQIWRRRSRSHSCNVDAGHRCSHACRCATTGAGDGRDSAVNCGGSAVGTYRLAWFFRAVYTGTRPG